MNVRILGPNGLERAHEVVSDLRSGSLERVPDSFLVDPGLSRELSVPVARPAVGSLASRFDVGLWLFKLLEHPRFDRAALYDAGLWTWLTLFLFDVVCPVGTGGTRAWQRDDARYIFARGNFRKQHRHLLAGPYFLVRHHIDAIGAIRAVLANPPHSPGELYEQLCARKAIFMSTAAMQVATSMYWDPGLKKLRRGAGGAGRGSPRRLADVLMQLDVTHDLVAARSEYLSTLLPREFERWIRK